MTKGASERVIGVEMRCVSATIASDFLINIAHLVAAMRWTRQLSSEATSTLSRRCSITSRRQSTRGWSERPSGGESGNSAKAGPETKSQRWQHLVSTKDISSIISRKPIEIDFRVSPSLCSVEHDSGVPNIISQTCTCLKHKHNQNRYPTQDMIHEYAP